MKSIWIKGVDRPSFPCLKGDRKTDVLIIGGGITGILCAYFLKHAGVDCILVEKDRICGGITQNTTAKITAQHGLIYDQMMRRYGWQYAHLYFQAQQEALEQYHDLCRLFPCDYETQHSYVYGLKDRAALEREAGALRSLGASASFKEEVPLGFSVAGCVCLENQAQFHPLKFLFQMAKDLPIYENTRILELKPHKARFSQGSVRFQAAIVATHFPFLNRHGLYFLKLYQHRSYVLALKRAPSFDGMYVDADQKGLSFRHYNGHLLLGGGSHRTGKQGGNWEELRKFARCHYPSSEEAAHFATQDCMTLDGIPYIGLYSKNTPNLYVATGFNKWGMTSSMVSAMLLRDLVLQKQNDAARVFSPSRSILHPQLLINVAESAWGLLTPFSPRCPHLGCALHYNPQEHSWDCSCHGSRFTEEGKVIDNPAVREKENLPQAPN